MAHFKIDGPWFANFARTRLKEGEWKSAISTLVDSLEGMTTDQAIAILKGEAELVGDSDSPDGIDIETLAEERALGDRIRLAAENGDGFIELELMNGDTLHSKIMVPMAPFLLWGLRDLNFTKYGIPKPKWSNVSKSGMKMSGDDPHHTDWMLGAGIPLADAYDHGEDPSTIGNMVRAAAYSKINDFMEKNTSRKFTILAWNKSIKTIHGNAVFPAPHERVAAGSIVFIPHAGPAYQAAMESANMADPWGNRGCTVTEIGGKLAHLAVVGRELKCTIIRVDNAMSTYSDGDRISIDMIEGTIQKVTW